MGGTIAVPIWLAWVLGLLAFFGLMDRLLMPSVRWFLRRRINHVIADVNARLKLKLPPFKLTRRETLIDRLLYDPKILAAVEEEATARGALREEVMQEAARYVREIVPAFNAYVYFRAGYWLARKLVRLLYRVRITYADGEALANLPPDATVVFVMNHRSNMDYVLVAYLAAGQTALSYAVGEWARVWPLQTLIRAMGAYFIRRDSKNPLYRRVLESYVHMAIEGGIPQAVYPEGGLTRDGRLRAPKLGLIDYMTKRFDMRHGRDIYFVPVGINYDRVLEDRSLLRSLDSAAQRRGAIQAMGVALGFLLRNLTQMMRKRWRRFGYASVTFGQPVSLRTWLDQRDVDLRALPRDDRFAVVQVLADDLMARVAASIPVLPIPLVSYVLARGPERGMTRDEISLAVSQHLTALPQAAALAAPKLDAAGTYSSRAVDYALNMLRLRKLIDQDHAGLYRILPHERQMIDYYAHSLERHWPD